jgi:hypothetical protein
MVGDTPVNEIFSVPASIPEDTHPHWVTKILAKDIPLQILIGWTGQAGRLLNLPSPIRKTSSG